MSFAPHGTPTGEDLRTASGKCLGEIVRKLGDRVLNQIIPILTMGIRDANPATREVPHCETKGTGEGLALLCQNIVWLMMIVSVALLLLFTCVPPPLHTLLPYQPCRSPPALTAVSAIVCPYCAFAMP